jgi:lysophospholipase L1-like esterase
MSLLTPVALPSRQDRLGTVLTDTTMATPVVYTKTTADELLATKASTTQLDAVSEVAEDAAQAADDAFEVAANAQGVATEAQQTAEAASAAAEAALAAAASFPVEDFLGTLITLADDTGLASALSGKWWQSGVAGLLTHANAGGLTVAIGDRLLSNGTIWLKYVNPPTYLPDGSVLRGKMELAAQDQWGRLESIAGYAYLIKDTLDQVGLAIRDDGTVLGKLGVSIGVPNGLSFTYGPAGINTLSLGTVPGILPVGVGSLDASNPRNDIAFAIVGANGREALRINGDGTVVVQKLSAPSTGADAEVIAARGSRTSLDLRLDAALTDHGLPRDGWWGLTNLRETRQRLRKLALGEAATLTVALIGDSWTHNYLRWSGPFASILKTAYGDAGLGWVGFGWPPGSPGSINGSINPPTCSVSSSGTWSPIYGTSVSPDICHAASSTAGDKLTIAGPAGCSLVKLFHQGGGSVRYRWNGGSFTAATLAGTSLQFLTLTGLPGTVWNLEIEIVSGTPILCGLDVHRSTSGVRVHKLGATGSRSQQWVDVDETQWESGISQLAPDLIVIMHGTNDQGASYAPSTFRTYIKDLVRRAKLARPTADVLLVAPCENQRPSNAFPMAGYTEETYQAAESYSAGFINLQPLFGIDPAEYSSTSARPWFNVDGVHPDPDTGGRAIIDAMIRAVTVT